MLPDAAIDAWLLEQFPGKTLEELDAINWPRLMRARAAVQVQYIETMLPLYHEKKWTPSVREWRMIQQHDELAKDG